MIINRGLRAQEEIEHEFSQHIPGCEVPDERYPSFGGVQENKRDRHDYHGCNACCIDVQRHHQDGADAPDLQTGAYSISTSCSCRSTRSSAGSARGVQERDTAMTNSYVSSWKQRRDWLATAFAVLIWFAALAAFVKSERLSGWLFLAALVAGAASLACWYKVGWKKTLYPDDE